MVQSYTMYLGIHFLLNIDQLLISPFQQNEISPMTKLIFDRYPKWYIRILYARSKVPKMVHLHISRHTIHSAQCNVVRYSKWYIYT